MRVVYCQFSTVANNVGVRIWDAKPDHYLTLINFLFILIVKLSSCYCILDDVNKLLLDWIG